MKTFEELRLWNDMVFVDVPKHRRLVCSKCGSRNVKVMPIFPGERHAGAWQAVMSLRTNCERQFVSPEWSPATRLTAP